MANSKKKKVNRDCPFERTDTDPLDREHKISCPEDAQRTEERHGKKSENCV